jgi:hypothetical protein
MIVDDDLTVNDLASVLDMPEVGVDIDESCTHRILCYGDSLTAGYCANGSQYSPYGDTLQDALISVGIQAEVYICGISGHRADQMVAELDDPLCKDMTGHYGKGLAHILDHDGPFDLVILMAGTNDFSPSQHYRSIEASIHKLHSTCHIREVPTMMLAPPCSNQNMRCELSGRLSSWASEKPLVMDFIDPEEVIPRSNSSFWDPDIVHFAPAGSHTLGLALVPRVWKFFWQKDQDGFASKRITTHQAIGYVFGGA